MESLHWVYTRSNGVKCGGEFYWWVGGLLYLIDGFFLVPLLRFRRFFMIPLCYARTTMLIAVIWIPTVYPHLIIDNVM